ncbi:NAD(P)-dependent oxidoreductase [Paenibacillus pini]|uniref:Rrf2-linked NADH-flavin reductase n=1 Tax=Paenibacillus pini JCM 16418 TaxID=1236976 RepID=W7YLJ1_9BACL|nr:NAD(P)-dependent oxidoreductase [Paenibacillus pini]GAF09447.1 Rrf2-linked NADH-flavin reductase [Paenibacillus pini JCM 16418]
MNIVIFGATGTVGFSLVQEALKRNHHVTAVVRDPERMKGTHENLELKQGDILSSDFVAEVVKGKEAVITAYGPVFGKEEELVEVARSLVEGLRRAEVSRLLIVGGAGSLEVEPGVRLLDTAEFPAELRPLAVAHAEAYEVFRQSDLEWTYCSPAAEMEPGRRTGQFRIGMDKLITDEAGNSRITVEDYAVALIDEMDDPYFVGTRFTVAY